MWPRLHGSAGQFLTPSTGGRQQGHAHGSTGYCASKSHRVTRWTQSSYTALEELRAEGSAPFVASGKEAGSPSPGSEQLYGSIRAVVTVTYLVTYVTSYGNGSQSEVREW